MMRFGRAFIVVLVTLLPLSAGAQTRAAAPVKAVKVTVLSTMLVGGSGAHRSGVSPAPGGWAGAFYGSGGRGGLGIYAG